MVLWLAPSLERQSYRIWPSPKCSRSWHRPFHRYYESESTFDSHRRNSCNPITRTVQLIVRRHTLWQWRAPHL